MTFLVTAPFSPLIELTVPLYHLCKSADDKKKHLEGWFLAAFRTATAVGFFLTFAHSIRYIGRDKLNQNLITTTFIIIHPYATTLLLAFANGGLEIAKKTTEIVTKNQFMLKRDEASYFALGLSFMYIAHFLKEGLKNHPLDKRYQEWANKLSTRLTRP